MCTLRNQEKSLHLSYLQLRDSHLKLQYGGVRGKGEKRWCN
jgi:hypothetical protein